jgi:hypothetical protein
LLALDAWPFECLNCGDIVMSSHILYLRRISSEGFLASSFELSPQSTVDHMREGAMLLSKMLLKLLPPLIIADVTIIFHCTTSQTSQKVCDTLIDAVIPSRGQRSRHRKASERLTKPIKPSQDPGHPAFHPQDVAKESCAKQWFRSSRCHSLCSDSA